jgi:exodeoxyribonuclease V gamma subunit
MSGLIIHTGNRLEMLGQQLAEDISISLSSVFEPEIIITQSPGMARWVAMQLAVHNRISANLVFPYPNTFLNLLCQRLSLDAPMPDDPFDPLNMTFSIMKNLPACLSRQGYEGLRNYFHEDRRQLKLLQLSRKIADLFDQYLVFRPDMIAAWETGQNEISEGAWQADLWREIAVGKEHLHRVNLHTELIGKLEGGRVAADVLPQRVSVFGISYLPAFHLNILSALSSRVPVNWYCLSPCRQYWGEVVSDRAASRIRETYAHDTLDENDLHLDRGNPLLASMGTLGKDFLGMVAASGCDLQEHYLPPGRDTLLSSIQEDILDMLDAAEVQKDAAPEPYHENAAFQADTDSSIEIHACHSPMREIEVLHDHLLDMLQHIPGLKPRDILVMTPDIDTYAPFIQAVFEQTAGSPAAIPFSLADRSTLYSSRIMEAFFALIDLAGSRMEVDRIMGLLESPAIRQQFNIDEQDVAVIEKWVRDLNIRWGIDALDRKDRGLPLFSENTWKSGLDRLLLGYALPGKDKHLFAGLLPYDHVEGEQGRVLGSFMDYFSCILNSVQILKTPKTLRDWSMHLHAIVECMFSDDDAWGKEMQILNQLLDRLANVQQVTGYDQLIDLEAVDYHLRGELENASYGAGFLTGKVTFCAMLPMRSIPFKVICLLGMNGNAFPRDDSNLGFDLMAAHARRGDRSRRNDDKYLFLEALMSARKKMYISYVGMDIQDNSLISPSVLVSELIDYAQSGYGCSEEDLVCFHPLQSFSADYFKNKPNLFSYSEENYAAAVAAQKDPVNPIPERLLSEPSEAFKDLGVESLAAFYANPVKYFLQHRLGIYLDNQDRLHDANEHFRLGGLEGYGAGRELFIAGCQASQVEQIRASFSARGVLPPGRVGEHDFAEIYQQSGDLVSRMNAMTLGREPQDRDVSLQLADFSISGTMPGVYEQGMILARFAKFSPRDLMRCWIAHLQLSAMAGPQGPQKKSVYLARDVSVVLDPPENSADILRHLLALYWNGLSDPLPFYPRSAYAYAQARLVKKRPRENALQAALKDLQGNPYRSGEIEEPYIHFYFDGVVTLGETFEKTALDIFKPLFENHTSTPYKPTFNPKVV